MIKIVSSDDGRGGESDSNNREYGGVLKNEGISAADPGPRIYLDSEDNPSIVLEGGYPSFHSHASGTKVVGQKEKGHRQPPSPTDFKGAENFIHYVFAKREGMVYIYDKHAVQATMPIKRFAKEWK